METVIPTAVHRPCPPPRPRAARRSAPEVRFVRPSAASRPLPGPAARTFTVPGSRIELVG